MAKSYEQAKENSKDKRYKSILLPDNSLSDKDISYYINKTELPSYWKVERCKLFNALLNPEFALLGYAKLAEISNLSEVSVRLALADDKFNNLLFKYRRRLSGVRLQRLLAVCERVAVATGSIQHIDYLFEFYGVHHRKQIFENASDEAVSETEKKDKINSFVVSYLNENFETLIKSNPALINKIKKLAG